MRKENALLYLALQQFFELQIHGCWMMFIQMHNNALAFQGVYTSVYHLILF